jgi:hypothetical protein
MEARWLKLARSYELTERQTASTQRIRGIFHSIHVLRKTGVWEIEFQIRLGKPPERCDEIAAILHGETIKAQVMAIILHGETIKAQVMAITMNPRKPRGRPAVEVHAKKFEP